MAQAPVLSVIIPGKIIGAYQEDGERVEGRQMVTRHIAFHSACRYLGRYG